MYKHTPNKTLIYVVHITPAPLSLPNTKKEYMGFYQNSINQIQIINTLKHYEQLRDGGTVILNNYELFMDKVFHSIKAI